MFVASCCREVLDWLTLASRDAAVCCERCAMWELIVLVMVSAVSSSDTSLAVRSAVRVV